MPAPLPRLPEPLRDAARRFADHWLPRTCALCDRTLGVHEHGLCRPCADELPGAGAARCPGCALAADTTDGLPGAGQRTGTLHRTDAGHTDARRCDACRAAPPAWDLALVAADYAPPIDRLIVALKFRGELAAARPLGLLLAERVARVLRPLPDLLVPVPLAPQRLAARGYNQSQAIAAAASRRLGIPVAPWMLARLRETPAQSRLPLARRRANLADAMRAEAAAAGRRIAVVDDVMTSGATAQAAALALKAAGARFVVNLAVARTP